LGAITLPIEFRRAVLRWQYGHHRGANNSFTGAAWVFTRSGEAWTQQGNKLVGTGAVGKEMAAVLRTGARIGTIYPLGRCAVHGEISNALRIRMFPLRLSFNNLPGVGGRRSRSVRRVRRISRNTQPIPSAY
jgi:hypothetical protein